MNLTTITLIVSLCLASFVLGMIVMALLLHPYRRELKRTHQRDAACQHYQRQLRDLDRQ